MERKRDRTDRLPTEPGETMFTLRAGDYITDPTSTNDRRIYGPCVINAHRFDDGGIDITVTRD